MKTIKAQVKMIKAQKNEKGKIIVMKQDGLKYINVNELTPEDTNLLQLYVVVNKAVKVGDYVLDLDTIHQVIEGDGCEGFEYDVIIATTNTALKLPRIPKQFVFKYIENPIPEILVGMDKDGIHTNKLNTITVYPVKRISWGREDVIKLVNEACLDQEKHGVKIDYDQLLKFIHSNL